MKIRSIMYKIDVAFVGLILGLTWAPAVASAEATPASAPNDSSVSTPATTTDKSSTNDATRLSNIISRGDQEIERRINNLNKLQDLINNSTKLTSTEKTDFLSEITSTISGLNTLKAQLDAATTLTEAQTDAQSIVTEYRVYALVDPKIHLLKLADDQQVVEAKLITLAQKLQTRITSAGSTNTANLQSLLTSMNSSISAAQAISTSIETSISNLQPTDYNSNHNVLEGDNTQLATARKDLETAYSDAKQIITGLESLSSSSPTTTSPSTNTTN